MLDISETAANSLLRRARAASRSRLPAADATARRCRYSRIEREIVGRFTDAVDDGDVDGMVAVLTDDAWLTMPPPPTPTRDATRSARSVGAEQRRGAPVRMVATRANGSRVAAT